MSLLTALPSRIEALVAPAAASAGLDAVVAACRAGGLEVHLLADVADDAQVRALRDELWARGIAPSQTHVCDPAVDAPARDRLAAVLSDQLARRRDRDLPAATSEPGWTLAVEGSEPLRERAWEAILTLGDGRTGTRGSLAVPTRDSDPGVRIAGVYRGSGPETDLLPGPLWSVLALAKEPIVHAPRRLDLHGATLHQELETEDGTVQVVELASHARPGTMALRARAPDGVLARRQGLLGTGGELGDHSATLDPPGAIAAAALDTRVRAADGTERFERLAAYAWRSDAGPPDADAATARAREAGAHGFDRILRDHRRAWARRWETSDIRIDGDDELQLATRLAIYHLIASTPEAGDGPVGARGLTGGAYRGHVFWDADVFVLPFHAATAPAASRAMLEYRLQRLGAAKQEARARGRRGACFAWESAADGREVTPTSGRLPSGEIVPIRTGELEDHIVADVAWAAHHHARWTGDAAFATGPGRRLLEETARFWASRIVMDAGSGHIRGVIGPDEYHENVDDNAYTNVMARWNLRAAADAGHPRPGTRAAAEHDHWRALADALSDGYDPATRLYEEFAGFFALEPLVIAEEAPHRPVSAPLLLGADRVRRAQVVKQADVLMLHYLVPEETAAGSLLSNLEYYEPRTAHGSTLSPGVHAALLARAGRPQAALDLLRLTSRIDLDDVSATTAGGMHLAAMGSLWRALTWGFAGISADAAALAVDPRPLPAGWRSLEARLQHHGVAVRVRVEPGSVEITPAAAITVRGPGSVEPERIGPAGRRFPLTDPEETTR